MYNYSSISNPRAYVTTGARISNNSWGGGKSSGIYDSDAQKYDALVRDAQPTNSTYSADGNQEMVIIFCHAAIPEAHTNQTDQHLPPPRM